MPSCTRHLQERNSRPSRPERSTTPSWHHTRSSISRSRIAALLAWQELAPVGDDPLTESNGESLRSEFNLYLQRRAADGPFEVLDVHAQVAADALNVRHHAAEVLLRLACARLVPEPSGGAPCLWAAVATGPPQIADVITRLNQSANAPDPGERMFRLLVPPGAREAARSNADVIAAANVFVTWLSFAADLLSPSEIDLQAANNKVKHGLAVRARSDMRVTFVTQRPDVDGSVPLSALTGDGAVDIFDQPVPRCSPMDRRRTDTARGWSSPSSA